jgi:ubiquinone/menaquinone biosynthesis C-methylase UbiE
MNIHIFYNTLNACFRKRRMKKFINELGVKENDSILDVGGTPYNWDIIKINNKKRITLLNLQVQENVNKEDDYIFVIGDAKKLDYKDDSFDIAFSNSVIEHLYNYDNHKKFAHEIRRVGKKLWVQTPNKFFFIEPHLMGVFIHYFNKRLQEKMIRFLTIWGLVTKPSRTEIKRFLNEVRLLNYQEFRSLFPDCEIYKEKFMGFTKSFIAVRK